MVEKKVYSDAEWRQRLSPEAYHVLRQRGTERAFSSPLNVEKRDGIYYCAGCQAPLFKADRKYESGSGWPSYYEPVSAEAITEHRDASLLPVRTEICCSACGSHLGHVFPDGPQPTGLRYCVNGASLSFNPVSEE